MKSRNNSVKYLGVVLGLLALAIAAYVLFLPPQPGVADQGDFDRVMNVSGLQLRASDVNNPDFDRFLNYTVTDYEIMDAGLMELAGRLKATSLSYPITLISLVCKAFGQDTFKTGYLAVVYILMYLSALYVIFRYLPVKNQIKLALFVLITLFVCLDGNYLVWFNSLYGEPMMITAFTLYIAAWVYYIYRRHVLRSEDRLFTSILLIIAAACLFLGSKIQVISALPVILIMLAMLFWDNKSWLRSYQKCLLCLSVCVLIIYPVRLIIANQDINKDTQYNSVFYGILKDSPNPAQDLIDMGLNPDLAVDAGKHSYLDREEYVKYVPHTEITQAEFYSHISNAMLLKFYITHPARLVRGMEYTAGQAFKTSTFLGKYPRSYSETPVREFDRFTCWSSFREHQLPKNMFFLILVYAVVLTISAGIYAKNRKIPAVKAWLQLFWGVMFIGLMQFPMPFFGNGQADTSKQLFLFNFIFDITMVVSVCWGLNKFIDYCCLKKSRAPEKTSYLNSL